MWLSCDCHVTLQISQALSEDLLLLPSDGRLGPAHSEKSITELTILSYRLETLCRGLGAELVGRVKIARLAANAMQLLLAVQLDVDTEKRFESEMYKSQMYRYNAGQPVSSLSSSYCT